jgi:hypothetical protein
VPLFGPKTAEMSDPDDSRGLGGGHE